MPINPLSFILVYMPAADLAMAAVAGSILAGAIVAAVQIVFEESK